MSGDQSSTMLADADVVPGTLPAARGDAPGAVCTIPGLPALPGMILLWFSPKRAGASLAAAGWGAAITAHIVTLAVGWGLILWAETDMMLNPVGATPWAFGTELGAPHMTWSECLRGPLAAWATGLHFDTAGPGGWAQPLLTFAGIEVGVVLLAVFLMPFAAAGEPGGRLFGRCLRLTWWSTTMMIPLGLGWLLDPLCRRLLALPDEWHPVDFAGLGLFGVWWLIVWLRSGYRYAGPADGPAWQPRTPRCEKCGYAIVGLPVTTNCPECARPVKESLPERRTAPAFATAQTWAGSVRAFCPTVRSSASDRTFFDRLAVLRGHTRARTFFLSVCLLNAVIVLLGTMAIQRAFVDKPVLRDLAAYGIVAACCWLVVQVLLAGLLTVVPALTTRRALQPVAVRMFYASSSVIAITCGAVVLALSCGLVGPSVDSIGTAWPAYLLYLLAGLILSLGLVSFGAGVVLTGRNMLRALRQTRFANA